MSSGSSIGPTSIGLSISGTIAVHVAVFVSLYVVADGYVPPVPPTPRVELVEVEVPKVVKPPPPPPPQARIAPQPPEPEAPKPRTVTRPQVRATPTPQPPAPQEPPPTAPVNPNAGGGPVYKTESFAGTTSYGPPTGSKTGTGTGGSGTGTGSGTGSGSVAAVVPVSVASIKTRAMPKSGQDYLKDYPAEARQLGIEGVIRVRLVVNADGKVVSKKLLGEGLGHGLNEFALAASDKLEFTPALDTNDKPVSSVVIWTFTMTLPK